MAVILAADVGGTKTVFDLRVDGRTRISRRFENAGFASFNALLAAFLADTAGPRPEVACLAVAGPVEGGRVFMTNLAWVVGETEVAAEFGIANVRVINDFVAIGHGIDALASGDIAVVQGGDMRERAPRVAIGAGTGLGVCPILWCHGDYVVLPSEGGHVGFAPSDEPTVELWRRLGKQFGRVSVERVASGPGLAAIAEVLGMGPIEPAEVTARAEANDPVAVGAVDMFARVLGAVSGDLALTLMARGGVFVAGGVAPRLPQHVFVKGYLAGFRDKGRYAAMMEQFPVRMVLNPAVGLMGAGRVAEAIARREHPGGG